MSQAFPETLDQYKWFVDKKKREISCCASNLTVNFSTIIVGRAGEPVSVFNLDA